VVAVSYQQTIRAYPSGSGSYIVARANLGATPELIAASPLLIDYVLTVSVRVAAGVAALTSAVPGLYGHRAALGHRHFRLMTGAGLWRWLQGDLTPLPAPVAHDAVPLTWFLVLRAFSPGCAALTGIEALSNGPPAFKPPESSNAARTMGWMAANISFADFPRLSSLLSRDRYAPRQFTTQGGQLVFSNGILVLGGLAALLIVLFRGETHALIPLYAVGVFISFTLSQAGMVRHWLVEHGTGWRWRLAINGTGTVVTGGRDHRHRRDEVHPRCLDRRAPDPDHGHGVPGRVPPL